MSVLINTFLNFGSVSLTENIVIDHFSSGHLYIFFLIQHLSDSVLSDVSKTENRK